MARRLTRLWRAAATLLALGCFTLALDCAHDDPSDPHPGETRLLDKACATTEGCVTGGTARVTTGPTSDSTGIRIGPGPGRATIVLPSFPTETYDSYIIEALVAGEGYAYGSMKFPVPDCTGGGVKCGNRFGLAFDYQWVTIGTVTGLDAGTMQKYVSFYLDVVDSTSHMDVMDVRYSRFVENQAACSVAGPGRRR
jgi:hypothetical protein